ncbi:MAG: extensin family protein [Pseudomonadota bacterium]
MRRFFNALGTMVAGAFVFGAGFWLISDPDTPLPPEWNPVTPLDLAQPETLWTAMKLRRALASTESCLATLDGHAIFERMEPLIGEGGCGIDPRVRLSQVGDARLAPVETTCAIALRLAAWERFSLQPAAEQHLGTRISELRHQSSYNCRPIRGGTRLSTHATAEAIDISGVVTTSGAHIPLLGNWGDGRSILGFYQEIHEGACDWFLTVLGPDFNNLHADHFHMQSVGWGSCR